MLSSTAFHVDGPEYDASAPNLMLIYFIVQFRCSMFLCIMRDIRVYDWLQSPVQSLIYDKSANADESELDSVVSCVASLYLLLITRDTAVSLERLIASPAAGNASLDTTDASFVHSQSVAVRVSKRSSKM